MDINQLWAQQQQALQQYLQTIQAFWYAGLAVMLGVNLIAAWVIYMFYARLRGIEQEIMKFRVAYEFANTPSASMTPRYARQEPSHWPEPPKPLVPMSDDGKYMPKQ